MSEESKNQDFHITADDEMAEKMSNTGLESGLGDIVNSDSKIPLKTPVKDGDAEAQVKFIINEPVNGRSKCMAENAIPSFSGLSKEELLKYANDPFWIRMRLLLFVFFWAVWIAMFVGAIAIIVLAPKCEPPKPPEWYQQGPLYEVDLTKFPQDGDSTSVLSSLKSKLGYLSDLKVKGLILSPVFKAEEGKEENVLDFTGVDERFGSEEELKELIDDFEGKKINVILSFVPNHSSNKHAWFNKSVARESPYEDYYVWAPASGVTTNGSRLPPNNWLSVTGGSAWEWVEERQEYYLHQFDVEQPDLNYHNPNVLKELESIFKHWLGMGVKGFNLDKVQYLLEDTGLENENPNGKPGAVHTQYEFYSHSKTHNVPAVANIVSSWRQIIKQETEDNGALIVTGDIPVPTDSNSSTVVVDISRNERLLKDLPKDFTARQLQRHLSHIINSKEDWPAVQLGDRFMKRVSELYGEDSVDALNMIMLLLKATPVVYFGEELGLSDAAQWNLKDEISSQKQANESHYKVFEALINARDTQTILYGNTTAKVVNDSVIVVVRVNLGNPGYLLAYNPSEEDVTVDLSDLHYVPADLMPYTRSVQTRSSTPSGQDKVKSDSVYLQSKSAAVFTFAPKTDE